MELLVAMGLPVMVLALTILGIRDLRSDRHRRGRGSAMAAAGFDLLQEALYPSKRHEIEQREHQALLADSAAESGPPNIALDLEKGIATVPRRRPSR